MLWLCLSNQTAYSQHYNRLTIDDGLSSDLVRSIYQDSTGYIWTGTYSGLSYFDGYNVEQIFDSNGNRVLDIRTIIEDPYGRIWFGGSNSNLYYFENGELNSMALVNQLQGSLINKLELFDNILMIGTSKGLGELDLGSMIMTQKPILNESIIDVEISGENLWLASKKEVIKVNSNNNKPEVLKVSVLNVNGVNNDVLINDDKQIYLGRSDGVFVFENGCQCFITLNKVFDGVNVKRLLSDRDYLWVGTIESGLYRYNTKTTEVKHLIQDAQNINSFPGNHVFSIFLDRNGVLWVGTFENGLIYFDLNQFAFNWFHRFAKPLKCMDSDVIYGFLEHDNYLWLATEKGLIKTNFVSGECQLFAHSMESQTSLSGNYIKSLRADLEGYLWVSSTSGLDKVNLETGEIKRILINHPNHSVSFSEKMSESELMVGTNSGLYVLNLDDDTFIPVEDDGNYFNQAVF